MSAKADRLYNLLPAVYRVKDAAQGEPLHALLTLIEQQYDALDKDISGLYENWFIETCDEWAVPYIGDLLGVRPLNAVSAGTFSARAYVAHTLDYRRRKGTAAMIESMARDVTGWPARVVEYFELLATTQYLNHPRPTNIATADLRRLNELELLGGPFEKAARSADVRHIARGRGRYNIPSLGIFLWRLQDYFVAQSDARAVASVPDGRYTFDPLGIGSPVCNRPQTRTDNGRLSEEVNVPGMLRRLPLYRELEALRQAAADGAPVPTPVYFGANPPFAVRVNGNLVPFEQIMICGIEDVSSTDWRRPAAAKAYRPAGSGGSADMPIALAVDPVRGRIAFPAGANPRSVEVSYTYAFSGDVGAGPYDRAAWLNSAATSPPPLSNPAHWRGWVGRNPAPGLDPAFVSLSAAISAWNALPSPADGVITILDSHSYAEDLTVNPVVLPSGARLLIVADDGVRPHLRGSIAVKGLGFLYIDGLLVQGALNTGPDSLAAIGLSHCTLTMGITLGGTAPLTVDLYRVNCGPISISQSEALLNVIDSIVGGSAHAISAANSTINIQTSTVLGSTACRIANASDSVFTDVVIAERHQTGCVRFCSLPVGSRTARRYYCQPDLALTGVVGGAARKSVIDRLTPQFTSLDMAQPGFAQLSARCDPGITAGADNGAEMGAFNFLLQPQRRKNLLTALDEYLRFGVEAGMIEES